MWLCVCVCVVYIYISIYLRSRILSDCPTINFLCAIVDGLQECLNFVSALLMCLIDSIVYWLCGHLDKYHGRVEGMCLSSLWNRIAERGNNDYRGDWAAPCRPIFTPTPVGFQFANSWRQALHQGSTETTPGVDGKPLYLPLIFIFDVGWLSSFICVDLTCWWTRRSTST